MRISALKAPTVIIEYNIGHITTASFRERQASAAPLIGTFLNSNYCHQFGNPEHQLRFSQSVYLDLDDWHMRGYIFHLPPDITNMAVLAVSNGIESEILSGYFATCGLTGSLRTPESIVKANMLGAQHGN